MQQSSSSKTLRGRFAPTPSGTMHVGNALAALMAWLQVRSAGGVFILRIEDIDTARSKAHFSEQIVSDLKWLGLDWDEGPDIGGPYAPYVQSKRLELYQEALRILKDKDLLYPCYCSRADILSVSSAPHGLSSEGPVYPGTCRNLGPEERTRRAELKQPSLRFKAPSRTISFVDGIAGPLQMQVDARGDFVIKRADGMFSYQLAVVVDDALMGITDVLRGADLLDSTPRQLLLYEALGQRPPRFAHIPLLVDKEGRRLAKRSRGLSLSNLRNEGIPAEQVVGWLAYASGLLDKPERVRPAELVSHFSLTRVTSRPIMMTDHMYSLLS